MRFSASAALAAAAALCCCAQLSLASKNVHFALNAGGPAHTTATGVTFAADTDDATTAFPRGVSATSPLQIGRVSPDDQILYQTERYAMTTFGYNIPKPKSGDYTLVLRFAEVYFRAPEQKMFDVSVNKVHMVVKDFDIFAEAGYATAFDLHIPLKFKGNELEIGGATSTVDDEFRVEFVKTLADNPKICAIAMIKGSPSDAQALFPLQELVHDEETLEDEEQELEDAPPPPPVQPSRKLKEKLVSQKRKVDPYEDSSELPIIPIFLALVAIVAIRQGYRMLTK